MSHIINRLLLATLLGPAIHLADAADKKMDFVLDVKPLLEAACLSCHREGQEKGKLRLETRELALKGGEKGAALVPGKPQDSPLYKATVLPPDHEDVMPPKEPLTREQTEVLHLWIDRGAEWPATVALQPTHRVDFVKEIQPILEYDCVSCHMAGHDKGRLRLDNKKDAFAGGDSGDGFFPRRPEDSWNYKLLVVPADDELLMPPKSKGGPLPKEQIDLVRLWIEQGAVWPEGVTLVARRRETAPAADEVQVVAEVHKLITARHDVKAAAAMKLYTNTIPGTYVSYAMTPIPAGEFLMGSPDSEPGRKPDEGPQHRVRLEPFWMGVCEVTWNEFELFMFPDEERKFKDALKTDPYTDKVSDAVTRPSKPYVEMSFGMGKDGYPAISMTQHAANKYCQWLSAKTGHFYRLPTEAEWEYACRAGTTTAYWFGDDAGRLGDHEWYEKNSDFKYQKVGRKRPNPWGLYDIHGNVAEWCLDQLASYEPLAGKTTDSPWVRATKSYPQVVRGGSWEDTADKLRSAARRGSDKAWKAQDPQLPQSVWYHTDAQFLGFRLVRPLKVPSAEEMHQYWNNGVEKE